MIREPKFRRSDVDIRNSTILISIDKNKKGELMLPRVFAKNDDGELEQIGRIHELELSADVQGPKLSIKALCPREHPSMDNNIRESVRRQRKILEDVGVDLNVCSCINNGEGVGIDPLCPIHGTNGE